MWVGVHRDEWAGQSLREGCMGFRGDLVSVNRDEQPVGTQDEK